MMGFITTARLQTRGRRLSPFFRKLCEKEDCKLFVAAARQRSVAFFLLSIRKKESHTKERYATAMVYVDSWDTFVERSISLFRADPVAVSCCFNLLTF